MEPYGLGAGGLLYGQDDPYVITVTKTQDRVGLALWHELPDRAVIWNVHPGTATADAGLITFDELLSINGEPCQTAIQAVTLIREAPQGPLRLKVVGCPVRLRLCQDGRSR